jgi:hypothetical protein
MKIRLNDKQEKKVFNLEKSIKQWRKSLNKNEALEDGYKEELECHLRDKIEHLMSLGASEEEAFQEALGKMGETSHIGGEFHKTNTRHLSGRPPWRKSLWMPGLLVPLLFYISQMN